MDDNSEPILLGGGLSADSALRAVEQFVARFVAMPSEHARLATVLWVAHTYLIEQFDSTPRLAFLSPEPGSGKTRALEIVGALVRRPMHAVHCSPAALFRSVADPENRPTILFDEIDTIFGPKAKDNEELRGFLNAGHRRSGVTYRCEGIGTSQRGVSFPSYAAVALAGLHDLPNTIASRAVVVRMRRRGPGEVLEPYRLRIHEPHGLAIGECLAEALGGLKLPSSPALPMGVADRPADVWEPLLAVAEAVRGDWAIRAHEACLHFVTGATTSEPSLSNLLLTDLRTVFAEAGDPEVLPTATILAGLRGIEESPWADLRGKPLDASALARRLRGYEVRSVNHRIGTAVAKGYRHADLLDLWQRYLPEDPPAPSQKPATAATPATPSLQPPISPLNEHKHEERRAGVGVAGGLNPAATSACEAATAAGTGRVHR